MIYSLVSKASKLPEDGMPQFCDVRDVAAAHVLWLTSSSAPSKRYLLSGGAFSWKMAVIHIAASRPENVTSRLPRGWEKLILDQSDDEIVKNAARIDNTPASKELALQFTPWPVTFDSALDSLLALEGAKLV
jgi:nucleoside-diphosphate-sugar epimerase